MFDALNAVQHRFLKKRFEKFLEMQKMLFNMTC